MSKAKAILTGLLATVYNKAPEEIAELLDKSDEELNEKEVLGSIKDMDKTRVSDLRTKYFDDGFKKAEKQSKSEIEKLFKDRFEIDSDKRGQELVDEIFEAAGKQTEGADPKQITDDDVKKHPVFLNMEKSFKKQITDQKAEFDTQLTAKEKEYQRKDVLGQVSKKGWAFIEKMKPLLSKDAERAANQKGMALKDFEQYEYEENENAPGGFLVYNKDGQLLTDEHGNRVDFDKLSSKIGNRYYDFEAAEDRKSPDSGGQQQQQNPNPNSKYSGPLPKTKEEYAKMISDKSIPLEQRIAIREAAPPEFHE